MTAVSRDVRDPRLKHQALRLNLGLGGGKGVVEVLGREGPRHEGDVLLEVDDPVARRLERGPKTGQIVGYVFVEGCHHGVTGR